MAKVSSREFWIGQLRRSGGLYRVLRGIWRKLRSVALGLGRVFLPFPKGTFSLHKRLGNGVAEGHVFFVSQQVPVFAPGSLVKRSGLNQDGFQPWPVFWARVDRARLSGPNLVLLDDRRRACEEAMFGREYARFDASYNSLVRGIPLRLEGNWTSIVGRLDDGYWHFLMDALTRLHALESFPPDTKILIRPHPAPWQRELFELFGIANRVVEADFTQVELEHYYFSSFTSMTGAWNAYGVDFLRGKLLPHAEADTSREKLYLCRGADWTRGIANDEEVCALMRSRGWKILEPEKLSLREQMGWFSKASVVCGGHGSALTNLLWASPGCRVLELCGDNFVLGSFEWLARCLDLEHSFLLFEGDHRLAFKIDLRRLEERLDNLSL
ncbi:MAG: glycosyltransferase family 61 protein [Kiritimatiellales bacterium]|nr:glycosyltransferase family 61 protein [Kiritimatiellales bacterium]